MISAIQKLEDGSISLTINIPLSRIEKTKEEILLEYVANAELPGFRKGKAPRDIVEKNIDSEKIREEILKKLLPEFYLEAIKDHKINPVVSPQINVNKIDDKNDWQFTALVCEAPDITLGSYKENVKKITAKSKIIVPGKEKNQVNFDEIVGELLKTAKVKIPKLIINREIDRLLSQTLDDIKKLGLTLDQYLASTGKTVELLRKDYEIKAENDLKLEFVLQKIAEIEKIAVEEKEIDEAIAKAKDETERQNLEQNRYLLANILRQQKTLDFIKSL